MKSPRKLLSSRAAITALAVLVIWIAMSFAFANSSSANAARKFGYFDTIYTDATKTEECGYYNSCTNTHSGCSTPYRTTEIIVCQ
jgi:hypothetical protein